MHGSSTRIFNLTDIPAPSFSTRRGGCRTCPLMISSHLRTGQFWRENHACHLKCVLQRVHGNLLRVRPVPLEPAYSVRIDAGVLS